LIKVVDNAFTQISLERETRGQETQRFNKITEKINTIRNDLLGTPLNCSTLVYFPTEAQKDFGQINHLVPRRTIAEAETSEEMVRVVNKGWPSISDVLAQLADAASEKANEALTRPRYAERLSTTSDKRDPTLKIFVIALHQLAINNFGSLTHPMIASIASAALNKEVDTNKVSSILRTWRDKGDKK